MVDTRNPEQPRYNRYGCRNHGYFQQFQILFRSLSISYENSSWILASILITGAVMTPIAGKLSDVYGKKSILLILLGVYITGLLIGSFAFDFLTLIIARAIQGIGISMFPIAFSILRDKFPVDKLAIAQGIFSSTLSGGAVIGLIIGGIIVDDFGWRTTFLLIAPIAVILFLVIARFVRVEKEQKYVSDKASEFCCIFTHVRKDILLTENTTVINTSNEAALSNRKSVDIKGVYISLVCNSLIFNYSSIFGKVYYIY